MFVSLDLKYVGSDQNNKYKEMNSCFYSDCTKWAKPSFHILGELP